MISVKELNPHGYMTTADQRFNLQTLCDRLNIIRAHYGIPMIVTSGLRSAEDQQGLIAAGISKATKSHHLTGEAADIYDPDGKLNAFCKENERLLIEAKLWCEERQGVWQHFQIVPPVSNNRWFQP